MKDLWFSRYGTYITASKDKVWICHLQLGVSFSHNVFFCFMVFGAIFLGWYVGSYVAQWFGGIFVMFVILMGWKRAQKYSTLEEARDMIDKLIEEREANKRAKSDGKK